MWLLLSLNLIGKLAAVFIGFADLTTALTLWFGTDALLAYHLFAPAAQGLGRMHRRFATPRHEVWLTIDDGPDPDDTPALLDLLAERGARATFFVIGEKAARHPDLIAAIIAEGHEVAHHTHTHPLGSFWFASPGRVARELDDATAVLRASGVNPTRFRPPAGIKNPWLARALQSRGLTGVVWSARGLERWAHDAPAVATRLLRNLGPGAILLVHEGPAVPAAIRVHAIRRVLERLHTLGYRCIIPRPDQLVD